MYYWWGFSCMLWLVKVAFVQVVLIKLELVLNTLWPSDAIWRRRYWSTLVQVMTCCLTAPSHYLNQCWRITCEVIWHSFQGNIYLNTQYINPQAVLEIQTLEIKVHLPGDNELISKCISSRQWKPRLVRSSSIYRASLTHWDQGKMVANWQTIFKLKFSWIKV